VQRQQMGQRVNGDQAAGSGGQHRKSVSPYHDAGSFGSGVVSLTISHRKV
jgi:hypothetical protein